MGGDGPAPSRGAPPDSRSEARAQELQNRGRRPPPKTAVGASERGAQSPLPESERGRNSPKLVRGFFVSVLE